MRKKTFLTIISLCILTSIGFGQAVKKADEGLMGRRYLTFNTVIRVNQIEVSRTRNVGADERPMHTPAKVKAFRRAV